MRAHIELYGQAKDVVRDIWSNVPGPEVIETATSFYFRQTIRAQLVARGVRRGRYRYNRLDLANGGGCCGHSRLARNSQ